VRTRGTCLLIFFSLYSRRSFLLISLAFENPLSIALSYPCLYKWWHKSPSLCILPPRSRRATWQLIYTLSPQTNINTFHPVIPRSRRATWQLIYVNCKTPNVVYLLDCHVCGSQYVGESVQPFNKRLKTVKEVHHIRCFAIDINQLSCCPPWPWW
jgi:hypothetical protein